MRWMLILAAVLVAGCDQRAQILEKEYADAEKYHIDSRKCAIATKIADVYLERSDQKKYQLWSIARDTDCSP